MLLGYTFCIKKLKFLMQFSCSNTYYKRPDVHAYKGNLFTPFMSIYTK